MNWYDETYGLLVTEYGEELTEDFLAHYGVKGQKWGVRNAEWYPIADWEAHLNRSDGNSRGLTYGSSRGNAGGLKEKIGAKVKSVTKAYKAYRTKKNRQKAAEQARAVKLENERRAAEEKAANEKAKQEKADMERVFSEGSVDEILKYVGKADNAVLTRALENRRLLDAKIRDVTPRQRTKLDKVMDGAEKLGVMARRVGTVASDVNSGISNVRNFLKTLGIIDDSPIDTVFNGDSAAIAKNILSEIRKGKMSSKDVTNATNALNNIQRIEKQVSDNEARIAKEAKDKAMAEEKEKYRKGSEKLREQYQKEYEKALKQDKKYLKEYEKEHGLAARIAREKQLKEEEREAAKRVEELKKKP